MLNKMLRSLFLSLVCIGAASAQAGGLDGESSAFLRSFADSPVKWLPWGDAAIERAKTEQLPVFLFVGSFTSELSGAEKYRRQQCCEPPCEDTPKHSTSSGSSSKFRK